MKIPKWLLDWMNLFEAANKDIQPIVQKPTKRFIEDVKPGDDIRIEWRRIKGGIGYLRCLNNDQETKKIFLEVSWKNYKEVIGTEPKEQIILSYDSLELKNFSLLNPLVEVETKTEESDYDIASLQKQMNKALEEENYEIAEELQKKIDKLLEKPK